METLMEGFGSASDRWRTLMYVLIRRYGRDRVLKLGVQDLIESIGLTTEYTLTIENCSELHGDAMKCRNRLMFFIEDIGGELAVSLKPILKYIDNSCKILQDESSRLIAIVVRGKY